MKTNRIQEKVDNTFNGALVSGFSKAKKILAARRLTEANRIKDALVKYAGIDEHTLVVIVQNNNILLDGRVNTMEQREDACKIVHSIVKHYVKLDNNLKVDIEYAGAEIYEY